MIIDVVSGNFTVALPYPRVSSKPDTAQLISYCQQLVVDFKAILFFAFDEGILSVISGCIVACSRWQRHAGSA